MFKIFSNIRAGKAYPLCLSKTKSPKMTLLPRRGALVTEYVVSETAINPVKKA
jgi:hypothetical protein